MKNTQNGKAPKGPTFSMLFHTLTHSAKTSASTIRASAETVQKQVVSNVEARITRLELIAEHIRGGGKLTAKQRKALSPPELAVVKAIEVQEHPDVKSAVAEFERMATTGANTIEKGVKTFFDKLGKF